VEVHGIEIPEDWTEGNLTTVQTLVDPPIDFGLNSQVMPQQNVCARAKVSAATLRRQEGPIEFGARGKQRPSPESDVDLLGEKARARQAKPANTDYSKVPLHAAPFGTK